MRIKNVDQYGIFFEREMYRIFRSSRQRLQDSELRSEKGQIEIKGCSLRNAAVVNTIQIINYLTFNLGRHFFPVLSVKLMLRLSRISAHRTQQLFAMSRLYHDHERDRLSDRRNEMKVRTRLSATRST
jgi:hypothetical protein